MLTLYQYKPAFQNQLRPLVKGLAHWGITPNQVTIAAMLVSLGMGVTLARFARMPAVWLALPLVLLLRMALNAIDGMLARDHGLTTTLGGLLNEMGDLLADAALYLPF
ncbi:MAG: CDP-alcohol phosphatidyltransferase family protein, partial [Acaryochloridaceae cyanobacterium SU_2_1]|nr:CDP-alcohol phosphatidyltransferase family protein [Acaryochloridaceae cyanobacterium SU_2_1]